MSSTTSDSNEPQAQAPRPPRRSVFWWLQKLISPVLLLAVGVALIALLGVGDPLVGRLLVYDALRANFLELEQRPDPECRYCADGAAFPGYEELVAVCGVAG